MGCSAHEKTDKAVDNCIMEINSAPDNMISIEKNGKKELTGLHYRTLKVCRE